LKLGDIIPEQIVEISSEEETSSQSESDDCSDDSDDADHCGPSAESSTSDDDSESSGSEEEYSSESDRTQFSEEKGIAKDKPHILDDRHNCVAISANPALIDDVHSTQFRQSEDTKLFLGQLSISSETEDIESFKSRSTSPSSPLAKSALIEGDKSQTSSILISETKPFFKSYGGWGDEPEPVPWDWERMPLDALGILQEQRRTPIHEFRERQGIAEPFVPVCCGIDCSNTEADCQSSRITTQMMKVNGRQQNKSNFHPREPEISLVVMFFAPDVVVKTMNALNLSTRQVLHQ
jgi:hypothetical protein